MIQVYYSIVILNNFRSLSVEELPTYIVYFPGITSIRRVKSLKDKNAPSDKVRLIFFEEFAGKCTLLNAFKDFIGP